MPVLVLVIPVDLHELLEDCGSASGTAYCKASGVMEMAEDLAIVLVVAIVGSENGGTGRASEVLDVELGPKSGDVASTEGTATLGTQQIESAEVVGLTEWEQLLICGDGSLLFVARACPR